MNCSYFHTHIDRLFDRETPENARTEMLRHLSECSECAKYYRQIKSAAESAAPRCEVRASASLKARILASATQNAHSPAGAPRKRCLAHWLRPLAAAAACIPLVVLIDNPGRQARVYAAKTLFRNAAATLGESGPFYMEMDVRTLPRENFSYIDASQPFVRHRMWVEPGIPGRWRLDRGGRTALCDGQRIRMWSADDRNGWIHPLDASAIEGFSLLLDPQALLLSEEALAASNTRTVYTKQVGDGEIQLTVEAPASGNFANDYLLNSSIAESDSRREYRFDRTTGHLTGITISQRIGNNTIPVIELRRIDYGTAMPDSLFAATPDGIEWKDLTRSVGGNRFTGITAEKAARKLFGAMQVWDKKLLEEVLVSYSIDGMKQYAGCRLLETKHTFRSGQYPGWFVPCLIAFADGSTEWVTVALRNDNAAQAWVADGGI